MNFRFLYSLFFFLFLPIYGYEQQLSICAIFKNEAPYLKEWIDYHESRGVEKFYLYNNDSTDHFQSVLNPYVNKGVVEVIYWPTESSNDEGWTFTYVTQTGAYNDAINKCRDISKWLAIIDVDEFIVPIHYKSIVDLLENEYSYVSGLCVNWQCYGTSNIEKVDEGKILSSLNMKMKWNHEWNKHSKSIVQPLHVNMCPNPHFCLYNNNHWHVDSNYNKCDMVTSTVNIDKIRINHYWTRDKEFLENKIKRYNRWGADLQGLINHADSMNFEYDPILSNYSRISCPER